MTRHLLFAVLISTTAFAQTGGRTTLPPTTKRPKDAPATPPEAVRPAIVATPVPRKRPAPKPASLAAVYTATVKAIFAKRWPDAVKPRIDEFTEGKVSCAFKLDAEGKVADFAVKENTSNEAFAKFCEQFVRETAFEKPPAKALAEGVLEIPFTFWIY